MSNREEKIREINRLRKIEEVKQLRAMQETSAPPPETAIGDSVLRGAAQGALLGFPDELTAAVGAGRDVLEATLGMRGDIDFTDAYDTYIDRIRQKDKEAAEANPIAYGSGQVGGAVLSAFVPGVGALNAAKGATAGTRAAQAATAGALSGAGVSDVKTLDGVTFDEAKELAGDVALGAGTGAVTQGVLDKASPAIAAQAKKLPGALKNAGERMAFKAAAGNQAKVWDQAVRQGRVNQIGRELLDDGVVTAGANAREVATRAGEKVDEAWEGMGQLFQQIDEAVPEGVVDGRDVADRILEFATKIDSPADEAAIENLLKQAAAFEKKGTMTLAEAQRIKNRYKWDPRSPQAMAVGKEANNAVKNAVGDAMEAGMERYATRASSAADEVVPTGEFAEVLRTGSGTTVAQPGGAVLREAERVAETAVEPQRALQLYQHLKKKYGTFATAEDAAEITANRIDKNQSISLGDKMAAAAGAAAGGVKGLALGAVNKLARERGASTAAVGLDKLGDLLKASPEAFGRYAPMLQEAAQRGNHALGVTHFLLSQQDPEYRALLEDK